MRLSSYRLTHARSIAPEAFRRWILGGIALGIIGYASFAVLDLGTGGWSGLMLSRHALLTLVCTLCLLVAIRGNEVIGSLATIFAAWLEVQTAFLNEATFPSAGVLIVPTLVLAFGLLYGARAGGLFALVSFIATYICYRLGPGWAAADPQSREYWLLMYGITLGSVWALLALGLAGFSRVFDAMQASRKELADAIEFSPDGILIVHHSGRIMLANPVAARLLRSNVATLTGAYCPQVLATLIGEPDALERMEIACLSPQGEMSMRFAGDPVTHVEASWRSMEGSRHQLRLRDVTSRVTAEDERQALEAQLAHAQRLDAVGRLAGGLSHDFNNILTAVSGSAELLRRARSDAERMELIDEIIDARDRGTALTRQLLSFSRRDVRQPRILDVADAVRGMERLLTRVAGEQAQLVFQLAPGCRISADPGQLEHALVNLVANARDAMPQGGTCTITVRTERPIDGAPQVVLSVCDTGSGMPEAVAARAFEPFFTTKARGQGTGLGLASVHAMVTQCNGTARITSELGRGTCITLELPAVIADVSDVIPTSAPAPLASGAHRILVAEDDSGTRRIVERLLTSAGYSVSLCADGAEAIAVIESPEVTIDLVLSDIMMPRHTGPEVAARVAQVRPGTPVLLMSGYAEDYLGDVLQNDVRHEVITKPFSGATLTARIASLIQSSQTAGA